MGKSEIMLKDGSYQEVEQTFRKTTCLPKCPYKKSSYLIARQELSTRSGWDSNPRPPA